MHEITAYQCDYCKKYGKSKSGIKKHETICYHNPVTRACATCANCFQKSYKIDKTTLGFDVEGDVYSRRPMCEAGQDISTLKDGRHSTNLRSNCRYWVELNEED